MRTVSYRLVDLIHARIPIGYVGENEHVQVRIDCKKAFDQYPTATPNLVVKPPQGDAYPAVIEQEGDIVTWMVTDSDLIYPGEGKIQIEFVDGVVVMKSPEGKTKIDPSIIPISPRPRPPHKNDGVPEGGTTGQMLAKKSNADFDTEWVEPSGEGSALSKLQAEYIPDTTQEITFDNVTGNVSAITHKENNVVVRTDTFTYGTSTITETRTLATGEVLRIVTDTTTLVTTIEYGEI